jgi:hypothetical protein
MEKLQENKLFQFFLANSDFCFSYILMVEVATT